ncbi:MAG: FtsX-like permease family protein, partial [Bacilli bacterium]
SMNLITDVPDSIDGENAGGIQKLDYISYNSLYSTLNSVTGLPTNYFHVLYGEEEYITESYDLIAGTYPKESNELVLVVDSYNRINFSILRALGFYNSNDVQEDALDSTSESHVKPITFESLLNKKYKIFKNDDFYKLDDSKEVLDGDGHLRNIHNYVQNDIDELYNNSSYGTELKITGILRPAQSSVVSLMTTGLCYLKSLQEEFTLENEGSQINEDLKDNVLMKNVEGVDTGKVFETFGTDLISTISKEDVSTSDIRTVFDKYFEFRRITNYNNVYNSISNYLYVGQTFGSDLVPEALLEHGINDLDYVSKYISNIYVKYLSNQYSSAINDVIGLYAYVSSYEIISNIVIFPANLTSKDKLLERLDEYNVINSEDTSDPDHASSLNEQVFYTDVVGSLTSGIGKMINIVSIVLIIFASISLLVSCVMTGIITYVSVIERTKEIGILRALGARKKDVGRLFEVESLFIGGIAGLIGCLVAYLVTIPLNQILNIVYAEYNIGNIADLSIVAALVLIAISVVLTLISGVIPSRLAAKKDPVTALRDE